jgi:hypothetical protein
MPELLYFPKFTFLFIIFVVLASDGRMDGTIQAIHVTITEVAFAYFGYYALVID